MNCINFFSQDNAIIRAVLQTRPHSCTLIWEVSRNKATWHVLLKSHHLVWEPFGIWNCQSAMLGFQSSKLIRAFWGTFRLLDCLPNLFKFISENTQNLQASTSQSKLKPDLIFLMIIWICFHSFSPHFLPVELLNHVNFPPQKRSLLLQLVVFTAFSNIICHIFTAQYLYYSLLLLWVHATMNKCFIIRIWLPFYNSWLTCGNDLEWNNGGKGWSDFSTNSKPSQCPRHCRSLLEAPVVTLPNISLLFPAKYANCFHIHSLQREEFRSLTILAADYWQGNKKQFNSSVRPSPALSG
jgi:hypothetical protein